jgi:hypothetical protein
MSDKKVVDRRGDILQEGSTGGRLMNLRLRVALVILAALTIGNVDASCPVETGFTTSYYYLISCNGVGCQPSRVVVGECSLSCDRTYSCWGNTECGGLVHCSTETFACPPCGLDVH